MRQEDHQKGPEIGGRYLRYVLYNRVVVYMFNFIDRQTLSILTEETKLDLGISEASASPAAFSLLSDHLSPRQRATVTVCGKL